MKTAALILITVAAAISVAQAYMHNGEPVDLTGRSSVVITLRQKGFEPREIFITTGTSVTFKTDLDVPFWPASDLHPSHSLYAAFDPTHSIGKDEQWTFIFNREGNWSFHNHLEATRTGRIVVVAPGAILPNASLPSCDDLDERAKKTCWAERIKDTLEERGLDAALNEMQLIALSDESFTGDCHAYAHDIGVLTYGKYGDRAPFTEKTGYCNDGFWHGYMEGYFTHHEKWQDAREFCDDIGRRLGSSYPLAMNQCNHGIGHGYMEYMLRTRPDLALEPDRIVKEVIDVCEVSNTDDTERLRCASGAYGVLESWMRLGRDYMATQSPRTLFELCGKSERSWARAGCAWEFAKRMTGFVKHNDPPALLRLLETQGKRANTPMGPIIESAAIQIGKQSTGPGSISLLNVCDVVSKQFQNVCVRGLAQGLFMSAPPGEEIERTSAFCLLPELSLPGKDECARVFLELTNLSYVKNRVRDACDILAPQVSYAREFCAQIDAQHI